MRSKKQGTSGIKFIARSAGTPSPDQYSGACHWMQVRQRAVENHPLANKMRNKALELKPRDHAGERELLAMWIELSGGPILVRDNIEMSRAAIEREHGPATVRTFDNVLKVDAALEAGEDPPAEVVDTEGRNITTHQSAITSLNFRDASPQYNGARHANLWGRDSYVRSLGA